MDQIYSLKLGGQTLVVLSSPDAVKDLLDKEAISTLAALPYSLESLGKI